MENEKFLLLGVFVLLFFSLAYGFLNGVSEEKDEPNVILIHMETSRADHISCYGYERNTTPNICNIAEEGVLFENAYSQGGSTYVSVPSIYFSLFPNCHSITSWFGEIDGKAYLFDILEDQGYETRFLTNFVPESGWERIGLNALEGDSDEIKNAIRNLSDQSPFFIGMHYNGAHRPYFDLDQEIKYFNENISINKSFAHHFNGAETWYWEKNKIRKSLTDERKKKLFNFLINRYDGAVKRTDDFVGEVIRILKDKNLYEDTLIIITADHGENLVEKDIGRYFANGGVFKETTHVPLIIKFPDSRYSNKRVSQIVRHVDLLPTLMDYMDIEHKKEIQGTSLIPAIKGNDLKLKSYANSRSHHALRTQENLFIHRDLGKAINITYRSLKRIAEENNRSGKNKDMLISFEKYNYNETLIKERIREHLQQWPTDQLFVLDEEGDKVKWSNNASVRNKLKEELFDIMGSCPNPQKESLKSSVSPDLRERLEELGYVR